MTYDSYTYKNVVLKMLQSLKVNIKTPVHLRHQEKKKIYGIFFFPDQIMSKISYNPRLLKCFKLQHFIVMTP